MAIDNNPQQTQADNAAYLQANPNALGTPAPVLANGQTAGSPQTGTQGLQMPTTPTTPPPTTPPPTGLQMPTTPSDQSKPQYDQQGMLVPGTGGLSAQGFQAAKNSGTAPPQDSGTASNLVKGFTPPEPSSLPTTPNISAFFQNNQNLQQQTQELMDFLSPPTQQQQIQDQLTKISGDQKVASDLNIQAMNLENLMSGQEDSVRQEIQASGGFATDAQIKNLSVARNHALLLQQQVLQQKISTAQQAVANDNTLLGQEKDMANQQFAQRSQIYQMVQQNQQNQMNAARDTIKTLISIPGGLAAYANDHQQAAYADQLMGFAPGTIDQLAFQQQADQALTQQKLQQGEEQQQFENQLKLENLGLDKAKLGIDLQQLDVAKYNAQTSRINANTTAANAGGGGMSEGDLIAYAQQYAATGNIPTGLPKGTFGAISQVAGALPKAPGTIVSSATGVVPPSNAFSNTQSDGVSATYNLITNVLPSLKTAFNNVTTNFGTGLFNALGMRTGNVTDYNSQRTSFLNALLLANSGKVVSETELKRYQGMIPSLSTLSKGNGNKQLDTLQKELTDKFNSYLANNQLNIVGYDPKNPTGLDIGSAAKFDQ